MPAPPATVYFNSACPVCKAGVCSMQERLPPGEIEWVDVHLHPEALQPLGLELEDVRERLHLVEGDGRVRLGFDAVVDTWSRLPRWGWLAAPLRWPGLRGLGQRAYDAFARRLYRWNRRRGHW